jgi:nucleoside-diphosphate-sugar epimerase
MEKMKKKILVCGSTGFIGRNTAEALASDPRYEVFGTYFKSRPLNNPRIRMIKADLTNKKEADRAISGKDIVIQAAAATSGAKDIINKPHCHVTDNAIMNAHIFRSAFEHKVKHLVFFSCTIMYHSGDVSVKETDFDANRNISGPYFGAAWTKVYNEKMCEFYSRIGDTKFTVIRHSNIYGPYDKFDLERSHVFGATITKVLNANEGSAITVWGDGSEERDLLYVSDIVDFVKATLKKQKDKFQLFNAGYGSSISVTELVKNIIKFSGNNVTIEYDLSKPTIKIKLCLDTTKAKKSIGWQPKVSLDDGIKKTIVWYKKHFK